MTFPTEDASPGAIGRPWESKQCKTFRLPVSNGIFDHYRRIGEAIWLFLYCIDKTTTESSELGGRKTGIVSGGAPIKDAAIAKRFDCSVKTVRRWRLLLSRECYIQTTRTPYGFTYKVLNSKKWWKEHSRSVADTLRANVNFSR